MLRPILHLSVHMQEKYVPHMHPELSPKVNQFAADLHERGIRTLWCAAAETRPMLFDASRYAPETIAAENRLVFQPNPGDLISASPGSSPVANPHVRDMLRDMENPLVIVTGGLFTACVKETIRDLVGRMYECRVPLDLVSDFYEPAHAKNENLFLNFMHREANLLIQQTNASRVKMTTSAAMLHELDGENKRPARVNGPAPGLQFEKA